MLDSSVAEHQGIVRVVLVRQLRRRLQCSIETYVNLCLAFLTTLGGNQDDTIGTLHTIDCCSGSILQYGDTLHRRDIHTAHRTLDTIDEDERVAVVPRARTTNDNLWLLLTRHTITLHGSNTREVTRQGCTNVADTGSTLQDLTCGLGDGTHDRSFLLLAITNDYHLSKGVVISKRNLELSLLSHFHLLGVHTYVGNNQDGTFRRNGNHEVTIHVGDSTCIGISLDFHCSTNQLFSRAVNDMTFHIDFLCLYAQTANHHHEKQGY